MFVFGKFVFDVTKYFTFVLNIYIFSVMLDHLIIVWRTSRKQLDNLRFLHGCILYIHKVVETTFQCLLFHLGIFIWVHVFLQ